jgi:hypothetical protein
LPVGKEWILCVGEEDCTSMKTDICISSFMADGYLAIVRAK